MENKPAKVQPTLMPMLSDNVSRRDILRHFSGLTFKKVIEGQFTSISTLRKNYGVPELERVLAILILDAAKAFGDTLTPDDGLELATEIQSTYYYLSLEDCFLVMQKVKRQKLFGKFCFNTVLQAFDEYDKDRYTKADEISYRIHQKVKDEPIIESKGLSPEGEKVLDKLSKILKEKRK